MVLQNLTTGLVPALFIHVQSPANDDCGITLPNGKLHYNWVEKLIRESNPHDGTTDDMTSPSSTLFFPSTHVPLLQFEGIMKLERKLQQMLV
jgi:hypothetical protein